MGSDKPLRIVVIMGTTRVQRQSVLVAQLVAEVGRGLPGVEIRVVDPVALSFAGDGNDPEGKNAAYTAITQWAEAFFVVVPEYNHSFPGSLKRMLDSEYETYIHKPVAFAGVSNSAWGGIRAIEALNQSVREMGLVSSSVDVHFPRVQELFDEQGQLLDVRYRQRVVWAYEELVWLAGTLRWGREHLSRT